MWRQSTYKALRDEIINYSRARRTWTDPNAMQVDAVHANVNQERQIDGSGSCSNKAGKHLSSNCDTDASNEIYVKQIQEKRKRRNFFSQKKQ